MKCILIDSNKYLDLYSSESIAKLIGSLLALKDRILVTRQIRDEVARRRTNVAIDHLNATWKERPKSLRLPVHLLSLSEAEKSKIQKRIEKANSEFQEVQKEVEEAMSRTQIEIAEGRDPITTQLHPLFEMFAQETPTQLTNARFRRELGNPPGKQANPLGDQITWEQFLTVVPGNDKVWVITGDSDFCHVMKDRSISLNPFLRDEIAKASGGKCEVRCFSSITDGLIDATRALLPGKPVNLTETEIEESRESEAPQPDAGGNPTCPKCGASMYVISYIRDGDKGAATWLCKKCRIRVRGKLPSRLIQRPPSASRK